MENILIKKKFTKIIKSILKISKKLIYSIFSKIIIKIFLKVDNFFYLRNGEKILNVFEEKYDKNELIFASFTQTYGNDRSLEIKLLEYDHIGRYIRNKCQYIVFSFRDCSDITVKNSIKILEEIFPKEKLVFLINNSLTYKQSLVKSFKKLKFMGVTDIILLQDDMYGLNNNFNKNFQETIDSILNGYKKLKLKWLFIMRSETIDPEKMSLSETEIDNTKFYEFSTTDFKKNTPRFSWSDGTYIADLDFLLALYINIGFYVKNSPWLTEYTIKKLMDKYKFTRYGINKHIFDSALIHGRHTVDAENLIDHLSQFFPFEATKDEFYKLIKKYI